MWACDVGMRGRCEVGMEPQQQGADAGLYKLKFLCHELGLSSHGTRAQLLERLGYATGENGAIEQKIDALYKKVLDTAGGGIMGVGAGSRPFDDVLRSHGSWSTEADRTGPYRRLQEAGPFIGNRTQGAMLHPPQSYGYASSMR